MRGFQYNRDEWGTIVGYRGLDKVKRKIAPIFLRRRKGEVLHDLPERIDSTYYLELELAKLEQRIGRAHRIGQKQAVNVINLVVEDTIEERVLEIIYQKQQLFAACSTPT